MSDPDTRLMRYRVIEELVVLASPADEQIATLRGFDGWYYELVLQWLNWPASMLPELRRLGALSPETVRTTDAVTKALIDLDRECGEELRSTGDAYAFTAEGVQQDPRWEKIRDLASIALDAFRELGIPTPKLSDDDFNQPRQDAP